LFSVRNSVSGMRISRTKALAITGALAVTGAFVATGVAAHASSVNSGRSARADAAVVSTMKADQAKSAADAVAQRAAAADAANRSAQRAALPAAPAPNAAAAAQAAAQKAATDAAAKASAEKAAADKAAADKAAADKAAADKAAADRAAAAKAAAAAAAKAKAAAATPAYTNNLDGWIKQAVSILDSNGTPTSYNAIYQAAMHESAGNPSAVNGWDSNAAKGTPSIGLLQVIQPTFNAYHLAGHNNIYNPVDNIIAGARYAAATYGSLDNVVAQRCGGSCWFGY
jgi:hypothetical protein